MKLIQMGDLLDTRPVPKWPLSAPFLATAFSFVLGLIIRPFVPPSLSPSYGNPIGVAAAGGFIAFVAIGVSYLAPTTRKFFGILIFATAAVLCTAAVVVCYPLLTSQPNAWELDTLKRSVLLLSSTIFCAGGTMILGAGLGWLRYIRALFRNDRCS
jgi:hypothetical protein